MRISKILMVFFVIGTFSFDGTGTMLSLFEKVEKNYVNKKKFSYKIVVHASCENKPNEILDSSEGLFLKKNGVTYQKISDNEVVDFKNYVFFSSETNKTAIINQKDKSTQFISITSLIKLLPEKQTISEKEDLIICVLNAPKIYQTPYYKAEIAINKDTYELVYQKLYMVGTNKYKVKGRLVEVVNPIIRLSYKTANKNDVLENNLVEQSNYFSNEKGKLRLAAKYAKYKLL